MADKEMGLTRQDLEWETPLHPPRRSLQSRLTATINHGLASMRFSRGYNHRRQSTAGLAVPGASLTANEAAKAEDGTAFDSKIDLPSHTPTHSSSSPPSATAVPTTTRPTLRSRLDALLPPDRTYFGRTRRFVLLALLAATVLLLVLILGLGIGLGLRHHGGTTFLPLPGNGAAVYTGDLTYFNLALGACGWTNTDTELVCAVAHSVFDAAQGSSSDPNSNPLCGKRIRIVRGKETGEGNVSVDVMVVDRCVGCQPTDLDLSPTAFDGLAEESEGRVIGSWSWLD